MQIELERNSFVAVIEIDKIKRQLEQDKKIDIPSIDEYWYLIGTEWSNWLEYDTDQCTNNPNWDYYTSIEDFWTPVLLKEFGFKKEEEKKYDYSVFQLCEIAYLTGQLTKSNTIEFPYHDIDEMFHGIYLPILNEWSKGIVNGIFKDSEEEGYIDAYAQRRLLELYKR